jgi:hypothetical protein
MRLDALKLAGRKGTGGSCRAEPVASLGYMPACELLGMLSSVVMSLGHPSPMCAWTSSSTRPLCGVLGGSSCTARVSKSVRPSQLCTRILTTISDHLDPGQRFKQTSPTASYPIRRNRPRKADELAHCSGSLPITIQPEERRIAHDSRHLLPD